MNPTILTYNHTYYDYKNIEGNTHDLESVAHSLSNLCRFTGHTDEFYSVAQHSVLVSLHCPKKYAREALLHDAHEAYVGDVNSPLKSILCDYKELEKKVSSQFRRYFDLPETTSKVVKYFDLFVLKREQESFFRGLDIAADHAWDLLRFIPSYGVKVRAVPPKVAKEMFLKRYAELWI